MKAVIYVVIGLLLAGCATTAHFEDWINGWVGADSTRLLNGNWGRLVETNKLPSGNTEYVFDLIDVQSKGDTVLPNTCIVHFEVDQETKKVIRIHHEGNRCKKAPSFV